MNMRFIKDYFHFNKRQERGVIVLAVIIIIMIVLNHYAPYFYQRSPESLNENKTYVKQLQLMAYEDMKAKEAVKKKYNKKVKAPLTLNINHTFDPNTITKKELIDFGLTKYVVENIHKYRLSGGRFQDAKDIEKIYGMNDNLSGQMLPWIIIKRVYQEKEELPKAKEIKPEITEEKQSIVEVKLGINTSDSSALLQVKGIGPFYAGAIIAYRNQLGGYIQLEQLMELYKMDSLKYHMMIGGLYLDSLLPIKIPLNTADFKSILKHPYIDYETTKYIVNKRKKLGKFSALYQLKDDEFMNIDLFEKIKPYLKLD